MNSAPVPTEKSFPSSIESFARKVTDAGDTMLVLCDVRTSQEMNSCVVERVIPLTVTPGVQALEVGRNNGAFVPSPVPLRFDRGSSSVGGTPSHRSRTSTAPAGTRPVPARSTP